MNLIIILNFSDEDINRFARIFYDRRNRQETLFPIVDEVVTRFNDLEVSEQDKFRKLLRDYTFVREGQKAIKGI